jgi:hypothetical protein
MLWFAVFTVIFFLLFVALRPDPVLQPDGSIDLAKALLIAILAALVIILFIWLIKMLVSRH